MASQEDTQEGDAKAELLAEAFEKEGLDAGYWLPKVTQILGIKCREALQHLEYEDYLKLECEVQHPWEKKALQKLWKITDGKTATKEVQKEHLEKTKQRQQEAKQALNDLTEMLNSHSHSQDALREKAETLWRAMEIPKEFWSPPEKPLAYLLERFQKQLELQEPSEGSGENIPDTEVLRWASEGLALQGIYRTNRPEDVLAKREQLLRVPEGFQLASPVQGSLLERKEFSSSAAEFTFTKSMEQLGFSMSVSAKSSFWRINLGLDVDHSSSLQSQDTHQSRSEQSYFCITKYQYIPLASCYFQRHQLCLSKAALQKLQDMEQKLLNFSREGDKSILLQMCESFFSRFGSHVCPGPLHFGGIFWWKASTEGFRAEQREEMKQQTSKALNCFVGASWGGFGYSVGGTPDVSKSSSKASVQGRARESSHTAIQLYAVNTGGPADTTSLPQWKTGLVSDNTTWCVIDRGFELIPVWDVILCNHCGDFKSVGQMSRALRTAYKALTNQSIGTIFGEELGSAVQEARDFMGNVKAWEVTKVDERKLKRLMELKDDLSAKTRNPSVWINLCLSDKALQDFLVNTVQSCQESPPENTTSIKEMLRSLLNPHIYSVEDFPQASFIMQWVFQTEHPFPRTPKVSELQELIKALQQMKEHIHAVTYRPGSSASDIHEAKIEATLTSSLTIYSLLQSLQEQAQKDMELLVLLIATSTGYQVESSTFQHLLGHPEIHYMAKEMEAAHAEYVELKVQDANRAEAFLLLTGLTVTPEGQELSPEQKRERLVFMEDHINGLWSTRIRNLLQKHCGDEDWEKLEGDLDSLISGCLEDKWEEERTENILRDLEQSQSKSDNSESKANETTANHKFLQLLKRLGLESHYPRKMGKQDLYPISKRSLQDSQPSQDKELPLYFLQKLLTVDYQVRYLTCWDEKNQKLAAWPKTTAKEHQQSETFENFLDKLMKPAPQRESRDSHVHPMDLQMAIFHCADDFLRQTLATKLAFCQLALPLLVPNPSTSHIEFLLYALSQIQKSWKEVDKSGKQSRTTSYKNKLIFQAQTPIVSFIRIGSSASSSKSQLLNALLSKHKHDTFFHRHCRGSTRERLLVEGLVEIAWYCPHGSPDDTFERCVAFCNLHGDARDHRAQLQFLQEVSAVNVALVSDWEHMDERGKKLLQDLWQSQRPLVCLLTEKKNVAAGQSSTNIKIGIKNKNEAELMVQLTKSIRDLLEDSNACFSLEACVDKARQHGFVVDADQPACVTAKAKAKELVELAVYRKLESAFSQWTWRLRSHILDVQMRLENKIRNGDLQNVTRKHLEGLVQETRDAIEKEVEEYFREVNDYGTLVQWKSSTELKLKELKETLLHETQKKCENLIELQKEQKKLDARKLEYEDELLRRSRELAVTLKGKSLSERELKDNFTALWNEWIAEVSHCVPPREQVDIDAEIEDALVEHFKEPGIHARIRTFPRSRGFSFVPEKHIVKKKYLGFFTDLRRIFSADVIVFQHITDNIIACVRANIDKKEEEKRDYSQNFIHEILNEVQEGVNSVPSNAKFTFNREYSIDFSLYLCTMAAERFKAMHEAFRMANDPVVYLNSKREDFFQCFQISCQGATSVTTFAGFLSNKIKPALYHTVYERTAKDIAEDMMRKFPDFQGSRANLEVCILRYLAEHENFEYFKCYLKHPEEFFQKYIAIQVHGYCSDGSRRLKFLDSSLNLLCGKILSAVSFSTQIVKDRKDGEDKVSLWLDEFCRELTEVINLPRSDLKAIEHQEVTDIEFLSRAMAEALDDLRDRLMKELADADLSSFSRQPHTILAEHFSGCWAQCPFCGAVCTNPMRDHDGDHEVVYHRPRALMGNMWQGTDQLVTDICSSLVTSNLKFTFDNDKWIPYRRYWDAGPPYSTWNIRPDSSMQAYWKWFVSHFRTQLEALYNGKFQGKGEIPQEWRRITKQEALSELEKR